MKLSDCKFTENDIKQLQDYRDRQEDLRLKLRFTAILSAALNKSDIEVAVENAAAAFGKHIETITYENPATVREVMSYIDDEFPVSYSHEAVRRLLIKNGLELLRPVKIPGNPPSPEIQKNC